MRGAGPGSLRALRAPRRPRAPAAAGLSPLAPRPCPSGYSPGSSCSGGWRIPGRAAGVTGRVGARTLQAERAQRDRLGPQRPGFPSSLLPGPLEAIAAISPPHPHPYSHSHSPGRPTCAVPPSVCRSPRGCRARARGLSPARHPWFPVPVPLTEPGSTGGSRIPPGAGLPGRGGGGAERAPPEPAPGPPPPRPATPLLGGAPAVPVPGAPGPSPAPGSCVPVPIPAARPAVCLGSHPRALPRSRSALSGSRPARGSCSLPAPWALSPPCATGHHEDPGWLRSGTRAGEVAQTPSNGPRGCPSPAAPGHRAPMGSVPRARCLLAWGASDFSYCR